MDKKERVRKQFGTHAQGYVTSSVHAQGYSLRRMIELTEAQPKWTVLDVSTGGGHTALAFAPFVARVIATDLTPEMLEVAERFIGERGMHNVEFKLADAERLPFQDGEFDLVTNRIALHHYPNARAAISEAARVIKAGGIFALSDNVVPPDKLTAGYINQFEKMRDPSHNWCYPLIRLEAMFGGAGLAITHSETFSKEMDLDDWARRMGHTETMISVLEARLTQAPKTVREFLKPRQVEGKMKFSLTEAIIIGRKGG